MPNICITLPTITSASLPRIRQIARLDWNRAEISKAKVREASGDICFAPCSIVRATEDANATQTTIRQNQLPNGLSIRPGPESRRLPGFEYGATKRIDTKGNSHHGENESKNVAVTAASAPKSSSATAPKAVTGAINADLVVPDNVLM